MLTFLCFMSFCKRTTERDSRQFSFFLCILNTITSCQKISCIIDFLLIGTILYTSQNSSNRHIGMLFSLNIQEKGYGYLLQ